MVQTARQYDKKKDVPLLWSALSGSCAGLLAPRRVSYYRALRHSFRYYTVLIILRHRVLGSSLPGRHGRSPSKARCAWRLCQPVLLRGQVENSDGSSLLWPILHHSVSNCAEARVICMGSQRWLLFLVQGRRHIRPLPRLWHHLLPCGYGPGTSHS